MPTQGIMEISDEVISILLVETHESSSHHNEFNLISVVAKSLQLFDTIFGLQVGVVSRSDGSH